MSGWFEEDTTPESEESSAGREHAGADRGPGDHGHGHRHGDAGHRDDGHDADPDPSTSSGGGARERYRVKGDELLAKVKQIVREGNVRKITIRKEDDEVLLSFPLAAGVLGAALLPMWAAIGAVAALVGNCSIEVERRE